MKWENRSEVMFDYSLIPENQIKKPPSSLQNAKNPRKFQLRGFFLNLKGFTFPPYP